MVPQRMLSQAPFLAPRCLWLCGEIVTSSNRESSKSSSFQGVPIFFVLSFWFEIHLWRAVEKPLAAFLFHACTTKASG